MLAIGSTSPGLLQAFIDFFSQVFPDYRERVVRHEAGHFLVGYLLGVPVAAYSLTLGKVRAWLAGCLVSGQPGGLVCVVWVG